MNEKELHHLRGGPAAGEKPVRGLLERFSGTTAGNPSEVLARMKEVMGIVVAVSGKDWPSTHELERQLPVWFVSGFRKSDTLPHDPRDLRQQVNDDAYFASWTLEDWLYSM